MKSKLISGGNMEFPDEGKELGDTESTAKFKDEYNKYMSQPKWKRTLTKFFRIFKK